MSAQYRKYYANNGVVAYGKADVLCDHLFLWATPNGPDSFDSLKNLLQEWTKATHAPGTPARRSILFCQLFDPKSLTAALDRLCSSTVLGLCWGRFACWRKSRSLAEPSTPRSQRVMVQRL